ncbi:hypothetical protein PR003_g18649 [Phytophthora rubi]|uniref:FYVE-type domain-containing protein n=1 Tax=Phytophthora rubi TaxID=129364 RepID=A0A6A3KEW0_9STRA|nr:hypothetical protein PR002_g18074 [Phytophthora rubi]KAE9004128.1 hypothetical protein PR001_g17795 [Phytophthora rubi]KAE9316732.1 hypothetical protein PR003_g18649 [Phytophthora rubi]
MSALYSKSFIFGSYEREIPCTNKPQDDDGSEHLVVKTKSFARTSILGRNEQWCYLDYFRRKDERDGFSVTKRALPASEPIPGRIVGESAHVDQLYGLNASYLVEKLPDRKGLRVVFRAWFESPESEEDQARDSRSTLSRSSRRQSSNSSSSSGSQSKIDRADTRKYKERMRRLLAMAHGVTHLPTIVRRRRFGLQEPADRSAIQAQNTRCPCCTHSLATMKLSLSAAASAIATRSLAHLKIATRRCYLCGYLVCANCWTAEHMESAVGRIAAIVVCTRCHANVQACQDSELSDERHRGPPRVAENSSNSRC